VRREISSSSARPHVFAFAQVFLAACALWLLLASARLEAQRPSAMQISGVVVDQTGAVLPNAQVALKSAGGAPLQSAATDQIGNFLLESVPPGRYDLLVTFDRFQPTTVRVTVGNRPLAPLRVTLPLAHLSQELTVGDAPANVTPDAGSNLDASTVDEKMIGNLPVFNQDVLATMSRFLDASAIGTNGATLVVNGIEVNSLSVSASAIQQIKINQDPYSAEFSRPGRGRIEVITKPGSQAYQGSVNVFFRDSALDARNAFATVRPPDQRRIFEGFLGGPVRHSATTAFTLSMKHDAEDTQAIVVAQDPPGLVRENIAAPFRNVLIAAGLTSQRGKNNTMALTASYQNETRHNQGVGGVTLPSAGTNWNSIEQDAIYTQQTVLTAKLLNQFRLLAGLEYETFSSASAAPSLVVLDAFTGGGAQGDRFRTEHHFTLTDTVTWSSGRQTVKVGFNVPDWSRRRFDDNTNTGGTFYFSSLADYAARRPYSFIEQVGNGHVTFLDKQVGGFAQDEIRLRPNLSVAPGIRYDWQNYVHDTNNVSPRASFAFAPTKSGTTVIRGGAGLFYDRTGANPIQDIIRYDGHRLLRYVIPDPGYPNPVQAGSQRAEPPSVVMFAPDLTIPSTVQYSVSLERQLRKGTSASATYIGTRGFKQFRSRDINAPAPPFYEIRPDPAFGVVRQIESAGRLLSHGLQLTLRGQVTRLFAGSVQYALVRALNDTSGINWMPPNSYDLSGEYALAEFNQRHRFDLLGTINPGSLFNLGVALALYSGRPYSVTTGHDDFNTGVANARPAGVPRNSLEGPAYADLDLRWSRDVFMNGKKRSAGPTATVGLDAFNVLNRVNDTRYIGTLTSPFFGRAVSAQPPRRMQVWLRFKF
jgi:outer membrane receptor protein involved in Fe transport